MEAHSGLGLPSLPPYFEVSNGIIDRTDISNSSSPILVKTPMVSLYSTKGTDPPSPCTSLLLDFLQAGLDLGLGLSTLNVQVTAISVGTDKRWAEDFLIVQFFRAVRKIHQPTKQMFPKWELSFVLEVLSEQPFAPSKAASLWNLTLQLVFLIAITSG